MHKMGNSLQLQSVADASANQHRRRRRRRPSTSFFLPIVAFILHSIQNLVIAQQCGIQANNALCPSWAPCCSQHGWCGSTSEYCGFGCQSASSMYGCTGGGYNYNYCGTSWTDASAKCGTKCPGGEDSECSGGEMCYADVNNCPAVSIGGNNPPPPPPSPSPPPPGPVSGYNYNYCGSTWDDAYYSCDRSCPGGTDGECLGSDRCFAGNAICPAVPVTGGGPQPPPGPPPPPPGPIATATDPDSRLIAYVGNWQACPSSSQTDAYTHLMIGFAVTYTWNEYQNNCNTACTLPSSVPICNNGVNQYQVDTWRSQNKKVLLSFGGAGMGGSWAGDRNNCWDYCFGKEEYLSSALVNIVQNQRLDGIDIDYEYCYDKANNRHGGCTQTTSLYSDAKAQNFLSELTRLLREKLDAVRPGYELTHAPMDADLTVDSPYYNILKAQNDKLDFLMPQFYNGLTRPVTDGFANSGVGTVSTESLYRNLVDDMFQREAEKVVFGFCIDDCSGTGSNANGNEAVAVLQELKQYNNNEFQCNGGAFFWVAAKDYGGGWSDLVWAEVSKTTGCSSGTRAPTISPTQRPTGPSKSPTTSPTASPMTPSPTKQPTKRPTFPTDPNFSTCGDGCATAPNDVNTLYPMANCIGFYFCWDGQPIVDYCSPGTWFDVDSGVCLGVIDNCRCTEAFTPAPVPQPVSSPSNCPTATWDVIGSADCSGYHYCTNGVMGELILCPAGQLFQSSFKGCDWNYNVDCGQSVSNPNPNPNPTPVDQSPNQSPITASNPNVSPTWPTTGSVWYPDWERSNTCQNDGGQPNWMDQHVGYYHSTEKECCDQWYWWTGCY